MACSAATAAAAAAAAFTSSQRIYTRRFQRRPLSFTVSASAEESDCNAEECAPDKEVGKVSMEWLAGEKTKVAGTYPPRKKGWTGYVEKDTAGQTNIYSVEPTVYVAESAISSGSSGKSADGSENTAAIIGGLALISIAAASSILIQVSKNPPQIQTSNYSGPPLSYYVTKFKPVSTFEASVNPEMQSSATIEASNPSESQVSSTVEASIPSESQMSSEAQPEIEAPTAPEVQA